MNLESEARRERQRRRKEVARGRQELRRLSGQAEIIRPGVRVVACSGLTISTNQIAVSGWSWTNERSPLCLGLGGRGGW